MNAPVQVPEDNAVGEEMTASVLVIACGALAREIRWLIATNGLHGVNLTCLPATLHNRPDRIPEAVRAAIARARDRYDRILIAYGDCGTGGKLDEVLEREGVERIEGPHCYAFFSGIDDFLARSGEEDLRTFFLTDFLAQHFDSLVFRPLGLDANPSLRDAYFGNYEKVVYLAQTNNPVLDRKAQAAAAKLGLAFERRFTGYGLLAPFLVGGSARDADRDPVA